MSQLGNAKTLEHLRHRIAALEGRSPALENSAAAYIDALPAGLSEIAWQDGRDRAAAHGFALSLARRAAGSSGVILWCGLAGFEQEHGAPYAPALAQMGLGLERLLMLRLHRHHDVLWAMEEGLKSRAIGLVIGEAVADFSQCRRLSLAGKATRRPCLLLRPLTGGASSAQRHWRVTSLPSQSPCHDEKSPGNAHWQADIVRERLGGPQPWSGG